MVQEFGHLQTSRASIEGTGEIEKALVRAITVRYKLDSFEVLWETSKFRKLISITFDFWPIKSLRAE